MVEKKCKHCAMMIPAWTNICPYCKKGQGWSRLAKIFLGVIILIVIGCFIDNSPPSSNKTIYSPTPIINKAARPPLRLVRYAHQVINIRSGRGKNFKVVGKLERGDKVEVGSYQDGWITVYQYGKKQGYVYGRLLKDSPVPPFEIINWSWYADSSFGINGAVIYVVEVRNNTNNYIRNLKLEFTTYDSSGNIIDTDFTYVNGLSPGGTGSSKGYATYFGRESKARIRIVPQ